MMVYRQVKELEAAGAFAAEIEVVPEKVASEICKADVAPSALHGSRRGLRRAISLRRGRSRIYAGASPRHAKVYRNFRAEFDRLQQERIAAFREYIEDVQSGAFPEEKHLVPISDEEFERFSRMLSG